FASPDRNRLQPREPHRHSHASQEGTSADVVRLRFHHFNPLTECNQTTSGNRPSIRPAPRHQPSALPPGSIPEDGACGDRKAPLRPTRRNRSGPAPARAGLDAAYRLDGPTRQHYENAQQPRGKPMTRLERVTLGAFFDYHTSGISLWRVYRRKWKDELILFLIGTFTTVGFIL